jgi:hypothetical protein
MPKPFTESPRKLKGAKAPELSSSQDRSFEIPNIPEYIIPIADEETPLKIDTTMPLVTIESDAAHTDVLSESIDGFSATPLITPNLTPRDEGEKLDPFARHVDLNDSSNDILDPLDIIRIEKSMQQGIHSASKSRSHSVKLNLSTSAGSPLRDEVPTSFVNIDKNTKSTPLKVSTFPSVIPKPSPSGHSQPLKTVIYNVSSDDEGEPPTVKHSGTHSHPSKLNERQEIISDDAVPRKETSPLSFRSAMLDSSSDFSGDEVDNEQFELELDPPRS